MSSKLVSSAATRYRLQNVKTDSDSLPKMCARINGCMPLALRQQNSANMEQDRNVDRIVLIKSQDNFPQRNIRYGSNAESVDA